VASDAARIPTPAGVVHLETPAGSVYVLLDDQPATDADGPVLTRSEIDAVLSLACRIAPEGYLRLTLWRELRALVSLKRALPEGGPAVVIEPGAMRGVTVDLTPVVEEEPAPVQQPAEQLALLA